MGHYRLSEIARLEQLQAARNKPSFQREPKQLWLTFRYRRPREVNQQISTVWKLLRNCPVSRIQRPLKTSMRLWIAETWKSTQWVMCLRASIWDRIHKVRSTLVADMGLLAKAAGSSVFLCRRSHNRAFTNRARKGLLSSTCRRRNCHIAQQLK